MPETHHAQAGLIIRVLPIVLGVALYFLLAHDIQSLPQLPINVQTQRRDEIQSIPNLTKVPLMVHIYGGSVSGGHGTPKVYTKYLEEFLQEIDYNLTIDNFAIPATGVGPWLDCGIETEHGRRKPDIIISEFHLNEGNHDALREWYDVLSRNAPQVIVFDLWSWLIPPDHECSRDPRFNTCNTYGVVLEEANKTVTNIRLHDNFSLLSMLQRDLYTWQKAVPDFFSKSEIGKECFDANAARQQDAVSVATLKKCHQLYAGAMQHGNEVYHLHLGRALFEHFQEIVLPRWNKTSNTILPNTTAPHQYMCVGNWGGEIPKKKSWNAAIIEQHGYTISNPHAPDPNKVTLHTNQTKSLLVLDLPRENVNAAVTPSNTARIAAVKIGFVGHNDPSEVVSYRLNDQSFSTLIKRPLTNNPIRVRQQFVFTGELPIRVTLDEAPPGAYLEFTDLVFIHPPTING